MLTLLEEGIKSPVSVDGGTGRNPALDLIPGLDSGFLRLVIPAGTPQKGHNPVWKRRPSVAAADFASRD